MLKSLKKRTNNHHTQIKNARKILRIFYFIKMPADVQANRGLMCKIQFSYAVPQA